VLVHARGGHPPWDVTPAEAAKLPPIDYSGQMEPRRGGQVIGRARGKHSRFRLSEADRTRMWAIYEQALAGQDRALGALVEALRKIDLWNDTLLIVTGDVPMNAEGRAPFGEGEDLSEPMLALPLMVHFPGNAHAGEKVAIPTQVSDLSRTALAALGLPIPEGIGGVDLFSTASSAMPPGGRPLYATLGSRYSMRWGDLVLFGVPGKPPQLCDLVSDPSCETDRHEKMPRAAQALWRATYDAELALRARRLAREPATVDPDTAAALQVWGD
jgi:hypothetical protein